METSKKLYHLWICLLFFLPYPCIYKIYLFVWVRDSCYGVLSNSLYHSHPGHFILLEIKLSKVCYRLFFSEKSVGTGSLHPSRNNSVLCLLEQLPGVCSRAEVIMKELLAKTLQGILFTPKISSCSQIL